ncbi:sensor histidine kinase [Cohnella sp. CFH 77786]|uniref:sensor histidine kinase n=1 Tax=Cohnella sp. CFH 77786 TaxID=2662265 RepID=UPI00351D2DBC
MTNAIRHARSESCRIQLEINKGNLYLKVADDGGGLPQSWKPGVGIRSMRERAEELGGTFRIVRGDPRGTAVAVTLPIERGELSDGNR